MLNLFEAKLIFIIKLSEQTKFSLICSVIVRKGILLLCPMVYYLEVNLYFGTSMNVKTILHPFYVDISVQIVVDFS